jgi:hypothetical protein
LKEAEIRRLAARQPGRVPPPWVLGYRGFTVRDLELPGAPPIFMGCTAAPRAHATLRAMPGIEDVLLWTGYRHVPKPDFAGVRWWLSDRGGPVPDTTPLDVLGPCPVGMAADAPRYEPERWNSAPDVEANNCYAYATDRRIGRFAKPGTGAGKPLPDYDPEDALACGDVIDAAKEDRLAPCSDVARPLAPGEGHYVALVMNYNGGWHWYRQDRRGCWSHKNGQAPATDRDEEGQRILDPRTAKLKMFPNFCIFMIVPPDATIA